MPYTFESTVTANGCYFIVRTCYCILLNSLTLKGNFIE